MTYWREQYDRIFLLLEEAGVPPTGQLSDRIEWLIESRKTTAEAYDDVLRRLQAIHDEQRGARRREDG